MAKKLTPAADDLLRAMRAGVIVHFMEYMGGSTRAYYFRNDTMKPCTKQAEALVSRGLAKHVSDGFGRNARLELTKDPTP
jgi:hypothetical protein